MSDPGSFFEAIKQGDEQTVREQLRQNPSLAAARAESGESPLLLAVYYGKQAVIDVLLSAGPEPDLFESAALGHTDRVSALVDSNPRAIDDFSPDGFTPLQLACYFGHPAVVDLLLQRGADVSPVSRHPMKVVAIHACVASGNPASRVPIVRSLLARGADVNAKHPGGYTPLHAAAQNGDIELARLLIESGAIPNPVTDEGQTPLSLAEEKGHTEVAVFLRAVSGVTD